MMEMISTTRSHSHNTSRLPEPPKSHSRRNDHHPTQDQPLPPPELAFPAHTPPPRPAERRSGRGLDGPMIPLVQPRVRETFFSPRFLVPTGDVGGGIRRCLRGG